MLPASIHEAALHPELSKAALEPILLARFPRMDFDFRFLLSVPEPIRWVSKSGSAKTKA